LFADIRGYSSWSENAPPEKVIEMLNDYLSLAAEIILAWNGTLDKFFGDGLMAIFNAPMLAATARDSETRLVGFIMGTNDLAKETRARIVPGRGPMLAWLSDCVLAAHAYNVEILDSVYNDIANTQGFMDECAQGRDLGFDGKTIIHPSQIDVCNTAYSPPPEEVAQARKIIAAFALPENKGKGVIQLDGKMVEKMHADIAQRTVAIANTIEAKG